MSRKHPSCIMVDLDGTLANNIPTLYAAYKNFLGRFHIVGTEREFVDLIGPPLPKAVEQLKERYKINKPLNELIAIYQESLQEGYDCSYELHTEADTFLEWAKQHNIPLILATAAPKRLAMAFIRRYDLERYFVRIVTGDDTHFTKIDPNYFLAIADDPANTLMIDDSTAVIAAANKAGLQTHLFRSDWKFLLDQFAIHFKETKVKPHFHVSVLPTVQKSPYSSEIRARIDEIWAIEQAKHPIDLFNGQILSHRESTPDRLVGEFVEYKDLIAQLIHPELKPVLNIQPVAITVFVTDNKHVLIGKRSEHVATHQNLFELVPSGGVDAVYLKKGVIDMEKLVLHELKEEANLLPDCVETLRATHVVHDPATDCFEICYMLTVQKREEVTTNSEHSELMWLPFKDAKEFIATNPFAPISAYVLSRVL